MGDCDAAGTVFFPRYPEYGDVCTNALFAKAGLFKPAMIKSYSIIGIPLVDLRARFVVPSEVFRPDGVLSLEILERRVWVRRVSETPVASRSEPIQRK